MSVYSVGKRIVGLMPGWLVRFRPFAVYEIPPGAHVGDSGPVRQASHTLDCDVRWIADAREAAPIASSELCGEWNGSMRRAVVARRDDRTVACAWIATETFSERELGLQFQLEPGEAWLFAAFVVPAYRNQGVYRQMLEFVVEGLGAEGMRRLLFGVALGNEPSRRAHARHGSTELGRIVALRTMGLTFCRCSGCLRRRGAKAGESVVRIEC